MCIQQEIYAHLIMYNFAEMITSAKVTLLFIEDIIWYIIPPD